MSRVLPREPRKGDLFLGEVTHCYTHNRGLLVSAPEGPLYMPTELLDDTRASVPSELIGKWVECEVECVLLDKRSIVVRPIIWFENERDTKDSYKRVREYWMSQRLHTQPET